MNQLISATKKAALKLLEIAASPLVTLAVIELVRVRPVTVANDQGRERSRLPYRDR